MSTQVRLVGWEEGLKKVQLNHLLRERCLLGLAEAKQKVDDLLLGQPVLVDCDSAESAHALIEEASSIGAVCEPLD